MKRTLTILLALLILNFSCEKVIEWDKNTKNIPLLIVEGRITNEKSPHLVRLSRAAENPNEKNPPVSGALVSISDGTETNLLTEDPANPGNYYTSPGIRGVVGKTYTLRIKFDGLEYIAAAYMVPVEPLDSFLHSDCNNGYKAEFDDKGDPSMIELNIDWSGGGCPDSVSCSSKIIHYKLDNIDVNKLFKPAQEEVCFPDSSCIIRKKYSLTPEYQEFLRSFLMETEWRGGIFDVERGNVITNLSEGAIGYFAACTVVSDTIKLTKR
jgi:hypothetical protein